MHQGPLPCRAHRTSSVSVLTSPLSHLCMCLQHKNTQISLNLEGGEGIEYTQESDHLAHISSSPSPTHGRQVDELSLSEILGTQNRLTMRKPHS